MEKAFIPEEKNIKFLKVNLKDKDEISQKEFVDQLEIISSISKFITAIVDETEINMAFNLYDMFEQFGSYKEKQREENVYLIRTMEIL